MIVLTQLEVIKLFKLRNLRNTELVSSSYD